MREGRLTTRPVREGGGGSDERRTPYHQASAGGGSDERRTPYHQASEGRGGGVMREGRLTTRPVREGGGE